MAEATWYRLDNVGKFYSAEAGSARQTVFRYTATMADDVDPEALQDALDKTVAAFPGFNVCLRTGFFWHYLESAPDAPLVTHEDLPICASLHTSSRSVLFRVSYHGPRINLEVSHIVADGRGALGFFKELLRRYVEHRYGVTGIAEDYDGSPGQQAEDSFSKYFEREKAAGTRSPRVWRLPGHADHHAPTFVEYHLPCRNVLAVAKGWGVTLTSLVIAAVLCAVRAGMPSRRRRDRALRVSVPVDLRGVFGSVTMRNFFGLAFVTYEPGEKDEPLEEVARKVGEQLTHAVSPEALKPRMNQMIALEKNPLLRVAPVYVKDLAIGIGDSRALRDVTVSVSNLGRIALDPALAAYVRDISVLTTPTSLNLTVCSLGDDLSIGMSTTLRDLTPVRELCRTFKGLDIEGHLNVMRTKGGEA